MGAGHNRLRAFVPPAICEFNLGNICRGAVRHTSPLLLTCRALKSHVHMWLGRAGRVRHGAVGMLVRRRCLGRFLRDRRPGRIRAAHVHRTVRTPCWHPATVARPSLCWPVLSVLVCRVCQSVLRHEHVGGCEQLHQQLHPHRQQRLQPQPRRGGCGGAGCAGLMLPDFFIKSLHSRGH